MILRLKGIFTQTSVSLEEATPDISHNFHILLYLTIGPNDQEGGHDYSLGICTPTWLDHNGQHAGPIWGVIFLSLIALMPRKSVLRLKG